MKIDLRETVFAVSFFSYLKEPVKEKGLRERQSLQIRKRAAKGKAALFPWKGLNIEDGKKKEDSCLRTEGKRRRCCKGEWGFVLW